MRWVHRSCYQFCFSQYEASIFCKYLATIFTITWFIFISYKICRESDRRAEDQWDSAEQSISTKLRSDKKRRQVEEEMNPSRRCLHKFFVFISLITGLAALAMAVGQIVGMIFQSDGPVQYVLRVYIMLPCWLNWNGQNLHVNPKFSVYGSHEEFFMHSLVY
jgi:hypothetical protein